MSAAEAGGGEGAGADAPAGAAGTDADRIPVRLVMPDRWLEHVEELPATATVEQAKRLGLRKLLLRETDRPEDFYVEYAERQVPDEGVTLQELGVEPREILSIRAYDLGHYPRFEG
jgi:hypothetical protein